MNRCFIITPNCEIKDTARLLHITADDCVLCADGGLESALDLGLPVTAVIGDFDSSEKPSGGDFKVITHPVKKDDTDTLLCLKYALKNGYKDITLLGGIGTRLDHVFANIQLLKYAHKANARFCIINDWVSMYYLKNGSREFTEKCKYLSVFSLSEESIGVSEIGTDYPLDNAVLTNSMPLGVSNSYKEKATVSVEDGELLIMLTKKE